MLKPQKVIYMWIIAFSKDNLNRPGKKRKFLQERKKFNIRCLYFNEFNGYPYFHEFSSIVRNCSHTKSWRMHIKFKTCKDFLDFLKMCPILLRVYFFQDNISDRCMKEEMILCVVDITHRTRHVCIFHTH